MLARRVIGMPLRRGPISTSLHSIAPLSTIPRRIANTNGHSKFTKQAEFRFVERDTVSNLYQRTYATSTLKFKQASISEDEYHEVADTCLDSLTDSLEQLVEAYDGSDADDYEAEYSSGVLTLRLGPHGTYVINKQPPNKQIWFSSPTSGPKRFDYDSTHNEWFMHKDGEEWNFRNILNRELSEIFNKPIKVDMGD